MLSKHSKLNAGGSEQGLIKITIKNTTLLGGLPLQRLIEGSGIQDEGAFKALESKQLVAKVGEKLSCPHSLLSDETTLVQNGVNQNARL